MTARHWPDVGEEVELVDGDETRVVVVRAYDPALGWLLGRMATIETLGDDSAWHDDPVLRDEHGEYRPLQEGR